MARPDDSSLDPEDLGAVEEQASRLLDRADAWERFPVPIDDLLAAAKVRLAPTSAFDAAAILGYLVGKAGNVATRVKSALGKVLGLYDAGEALIHIDSTVVRPKQTFLKLHETGHHDLPTHRKMFQFFQDCKSTLKPEIADQFEREANNYARFVLFKGGTFAERAADRPLAITTPMHLAKKFGASVYASAREYARTNHESCALFVLDPVETIEGVGLRAPVRRIETSPTFCAQFGQPALKAILPTHTLWPILPVDRKMTAPTLVVLPDRNGELHECLAEAFDTTYNILVLVYPLKAPRLPH